MAEALMKKGMNVFIRTVTHYYTGCVMEMDDLYIQLSDAAWITDTRRFANWLKNGPADNCEIEPYPKGEAVYVTKASIVDWSIWPHKLPIEQQ